MKHSTGMLRRCLAMLLAVALVLNSGGFSGMSHVHAEEQTSVTLHELIISNYGGQLTEKEKTIINSGAISADKLFTYVTPGEDDNLISVKEDDKTVTAKSFKDTENGHTWIPLSFDLKSGSEVMEGHDDLVLTANGDVYTGSYTTDSNHFSVEVTYVLNIPVDAATQRAMLDAGKLLADDIGDLKYLNDVSIFPEKPTGEDWEQLSDVEKAKYDEYAAIEAQIQTMIKQMFESQGMPVPEGDIKITAEMVLMYLTMEALELDGKKTSAVEQIYSLSKPELITLPNGSFYVVGLQYPDAQNAATNLYNQKTTGLKLYNNIKENAAVSYLEWLMKDTQDLKDALESNYADLNYLANNSSYGLLSVSAQLGLLLQAIESYVVSEAGKNGYEGIDSIEAFEEKLAEVQKERNNQLKTLNDALKAYEYPNTVTCADDIDTAIAWLNANKTALFEKALGTNLKTLNDKLDEIGCPQDVSAATYSEDIDKAIKWLNENQKNLFATAVNSQLAQLNEALGKVGYKGTVTAANYSADIDAAIAYAQAADGMLAYFCGKINTMLSTTLPSQQLTLLQYSGIYPVDSLDDIKNLRATLAQLKSQGMVQEQQYVSADAALATAETAFTEVVPTLTTAKTELTKAETQFNTIFAQNIADLNTAKSAETLFATEFNNKLTELGTAKQALKTVEMLESAKKQLDDARQKKQLLDMVIIIMQLLCENLKYANDNFANDTWNGLKILDASKISDYAALNEAAQGLSVTPDVDVKEALYVTSAKVNYNLSMYNITVEIAAQIVDPSQPDTKTMTELTAYTAESFTMRKDSTAAEIQTEIDKILDAAKASAKAQADWVKANVDETNYECKVVTVLPDALDADLTYRVLYSPKNYTVTFEGFTVGGKSELTVPYGYRLTLPAHDTEGMEYVYTVGTKDNIDQGTIVTIVDDIPISRKEGKASERQNLNKLVAETILQANSGILLNDAVTRFGSVSIVLPGRDQLTVTSNPNGSGVLIKATSLKSRVGELEWEAKKGYLQLENGSKVDFELDANGEYITDQLFKYVYVTFELPLTAEGLGVEEEELLQVINIPYTLKTDYDNQKKALDGLYTQQSNLKKLNNNSNEAIEVAGTPYTIKGLLGALSSLKDFFKLSDAAVAAAAKLAAMIPETEGAYLPLCTTLDNYKSEGMLNFYKNEATYLKQINELYVLLQELVNDDSLMALLASEGYDVMFNNAKAALEEAYKLNDEYAIDRELVSVSSEELPTLLENLAKAQVQKYTSVPADMTWSREVQGTPPGMRSVTLTIKFQGKTAEDKWSVKDGFVVSEAEITDRIEAKLAEVGMTAALEKHYIRKISSYDASIVKDTTIEVSWEAKKYNVVIAGESFGTVTIAGGNLGKLPVHTTEGYEYTYYIGTTPMVQGEDCIFTSAMVADLVNAEGVITITRTETNVAEKNLINSANALGVVLSKDAEGKYIMVLPVDASSTDSATASLMNFMMGQIGNETSLGGEPFFDGKFHLQTLVNVLLNSGMDTQSVKDMVNADGSVVNDLTVDKSSILGTVTGTELTDGSGVPTGKVALGGTLVKTTLTLGKGTYDFYITLTGSGADLEGLVSKLEAKGVVFALEEGTANVSVEVPDEYYAIYAAALTLVGEADVKDINAINAEVAFGYLIDLLQPVLSDKNVDMETFEKTLDQFGVTVDLKDYQGIYNRVAAYLTSDDVKYTGNACELAITDLGINSLVDSLAGKIKLPDALGDVTLGSLIYEYQEAGETADQYGIDLKVSAGLVNIDKTYVALAVDATGKKLYMVTEDELAAIADAQYVLLLDDITGNLSLNAMVLDLNGKTVTGNVNGSRLRIVDNAYTAEAPGKVSGTVSVAAILGGAYDADVTAMLPAGYVQGADGEVYNTLYTITCDKDNKTTVALNPSTVIKELANREGLTNLAVELAIDLVMNYYNTAALTVNEHAVFAMDLENVVDIVSGEGRLHNIIGQGLGCVSAPAMAELVNDIVAALTDFEAMHAALIEGGDGVICTFDTVTAPWKLEVLHITAEDYLTANLSAADTTKAGKLEFVIDGDDTAGDMTQELADLTGALADTATVTSKLTLEDMVLDGTSIVVKGSYDGAVVLDFTQDPDYVVMMAVILANGNPDIRARLVSGIQDYSENGYKNPGQIKKVFDSLTIGQIDKALGNTGRHESFTAMVKELGLEAYVSEELASDDTAKGFDLAIDVLGVIMRRVDKETSTRTLGGVESAEKYGVYELDYARTFNGSKALKAGYDVKYDLKLDKIAVTVNLFAEHVCTPGTAVVENEVKGSCTEPGSYDEVVYCTKCGEEISRTTVPVEAPGHTYSFTFTWNTEDYSCKAQVTCTKCDKVTATVDCTVEKKTFDDRSEYTATALYDGASATSEVVIVYHAPQVSDPFVDNSADAEDHVYGWIAQRVEDVPNADTVPGIENIDGILTLDKVSSGVTMEDLKKVLAATVENDADGKPEFHFYADGVEITDANALVVNGSVMHVIAENKAGQKAVVRWLIIVSGDTNCNGRIESGDAVKMWKHFQGVENMTGAALLAADTNRNARIESGDAVKNTFKYQNADDYISSLK